MKEFVVRSDWNCCWVRSTLCSTVSACARNHILTVFNAVFLELFVGISTNLQLQWSWAQRWTD